MSNPAVTPWGAYSRCFRLYTSGLIWLAVYTLAMIVLKYVALSAVMATAIAAIPVVPFAFFLHAFVRTVRDADELQRKIQLEALAIAFPLTIAGLMFLGLIQLAMPLDHDWNYLHIWTYLPVIYFCSVAFVSRRYR